MCGIILPKFIIEGACSTQNSWIFGKQDIQTIPKSIDKNKKVIKSSKKFVTISNDCERHYISGTLKLFVIWVFINI